MYHFGLILIFLIPSSLSSHNQHLYPPKEIPPLPSPPHVQMPNIPSPEIAALAQQAQKTRDNQEQFDQKIYQKGVTLTPNTPAWFMSISRQSYPTAANFTSLALLIESITKYVSEVYNLNKDQVTYGLTHIDMNDILGKTCPMQVDYPWQPKKYRAFSGYGNNVQNPKWGNSNTRFIRFLPADYADSVSLPRGGSLESTDLPSAREVSLAVHGDSDLPHQYLMAMTAAWGEFIAHDLAHVPQMTGYLGNGLKCCSVNYADFHPECYPIRLPDNDPVHAANGERCQDYVRSMIAPRTGCTLGPREQLNQATSFIDASMVYSSSEEQSRELRTFSGGKLKTQYCSCRSVLLPADQDPRNCRRHSTYRCFKAGDPRVNDNIGQVLLHTVWVREHNQLTEELHRLNPHWNDETLFQEAKRIVAAKIQHITYAEYLPVVLGKDIIEKYGLTLQPFGYFTGYDININAGIANAAAVAALKFISTLMPKTLSIIDGRQRVEQELASTFYEPSTMYTPGGFDKVLTGLLHGAAQSEDNHINDVMTNHMFQENKSTASGLDLAAQIIQQGRDHGIPPYYKWREFCHLAPVQTFLDLQDLMAPEVVTALQNVYQNIIDIDLFTGGISETPSPGSAIGPTFACILARQFHNLKRGDRFWYENDLPPSSFTEEQLYELRKVTLARVICDNSDNVTQVQPNVFLEKDPFLNAMIPCQTNIIKKMDLTPWKMDQRTYSISQEILNEAVRKAKEDLEYIKLQENNIYQLKTGADPGSPAGSAYAATRPKRQASDMVTTSMVLQLASSKLINSYFQENFKDEENGIESINSVELQQFLDSLPNIDIKDVLQIPRSEKCEEQSLPCDHTSKFRSVTGWCNNMKQPAQGKSFRAFKRLLPPKYDDGVGSPRVTSVSGKLLPSARSVSTNMHPDTSRPHVRYSLMFMQLAQIVDHDLTHSPVNKAFVGDAILDCRPCDAMTSVHPECFPIPVPPGDPYFPRVNITTGHALCIPVTRSMPGQLTLGYREQLNQVTAYLDGSHIYGSDPCDARILRSFNRGKLNVTLHPIRGGKDLLPQITTHPECKSPSKVCFRGGDARASEQPGLAALHTVFLREHNRIADTLSKLNAHWIDETIYQQTRRILSATFQHITFNELLPRIFGREGVYKHGLTLESEGYYKGYNPHCDVTIFNEFASAAFRFGHSLLKPSLLRVDQNYNIVDVVRLRDTFFNPNILYDKNMVDELLRGLAFTPMETMDQFITQEVTNHLFEDKKMPYSGLDLPAINIQRGRDHGIQSYNNYRVFCNMSKAKDFDDLKQDIPAPAVEALRRIYSHVDDIDLFPGGLSEKPLMGGVIGPTFACIIGLQFRQIKSCDRFWYENEDPLVRFTEAQLMEIRKSSLAKLICDNSDTISDIQREVLDLQDHFLNPLVPCNNLPSIDLNMWKDRHTCTVGDTVLDMGGTKRISPCVMCTCTREGPICQSLKIVNCFHLAKSFRHEDVLQDHVCKVQCAFVFRGLPEMLRYERSQLGFT